MADLYDSLSPAAQASFRAALFARVSQDACPTVDLAGITTADSLMDAGDRGMAIDCFQTINHVGSGGVGVLDQATYQAVMGTSGSTVLKALAIGAAVIVGLRMLGNKRRRRR
jgi:hypothetical protein